jgi:hypothetical protein
MDRKPTTFMPSVKPKHHRKKAKRDPRRKKKNAG